MTYGLGVFWKLRRPSNLTGIDLDPAKAPDGVGRCFTNLPYKDASFKYVVYGPPYKLNGAPTVSVDKRYGVHTYTKWQDRMKLLMDGLSEAIRVFDGEGFILVKCQDQVCSGKVVWQTLEVINFCQSRGLRLVDRMDMLSYRPQPPGRRQVHARRNTSTLLIFERKERA